VHCGEQVKRLALQKQKPLMKQLFTIATAGMLLFSAMTSNAQSCCQKPTGKDMKALALNKSFKSAHAAPLPFNYVAEKGSMMQFEVPLGKDGSAFYVPADEQTDKVLIVVHEWWGLNDYIKKEAEKWQKLLGGKVAVYAVDLYDGQVATTPDEAGKLMGGLDAKRAQSILMSLVHKIGPGKSIATLGWCMGGSWSFAGTLEAGSRAAGCVMYYGFPEKDVNRIKGLNADVLYIYGTKDNFIKEPDVKQFGKQVTATGHKFTFQSYDAVHAFANPSNPNYDAKSAAAAQVLALKFLKEKLAIK
jgi:carboxymethylenebutenolidase